VLIVCDVRLLQKLPLGKYSAFNIIMWGVVLSCFAAVKDFSGAVAIRFFLGVFEAAVTPGFALFTSQWYTKKEQGTRIGIWFSFNGFAQIFGGLVAYGIAKGTENGSAIAPWKIIFLLTGLLTTTMGIFFMFWMPDNQMNARFLSKEDRVLAIERIRVNQQGVGNKHWKFYQIKEALLDPLTWAFFFYALVADIPNGNSTSSSSLLKARPLINHSRRHIQFFLSLNPLFWLHASTIPPLRHSRWRHRSSLLDILRVSRGPLWPTHPLFQHWPHDRHARHDSHHSHSLGQPNWPPHRLLPNPSVSLPLCLPLISHRIERSRLHQKDHDCGAIPHCLLCRQYHWPPDVSRN